MTVKYKINIIDKLTWPVSVSNLYSLIAGLLDPTFVFRGVTDGAIIIHETGFPGKL